MKFLVTDSACHHDATLKIPDEIYSKLIEVTCDVIIDAIPADQVAQRDALAELRHSVLEVVAQLSD